jgi:hypothetical protein
VYFHRLLPASGRQAAFWYALAVGGWVRSMRRKAARVSVDSFGDPLIHGAFLAGLDEAAGLLAQYEPVAHPLDTGIAVDDATLGAEQARHLALLRRSSHNWQDGTLVAGDLEAHGDLWRAVVSAGSTVYIVPSPGSDVLLTMVAHGWDADTVEWVPFSGSTREWMTRGLHAEHVWHELHATSLVLKVWWD